MYSSSLLLILTVVFVSTQFDEVSSEEGKNLTEVSEVDCTTEYRQSLRDARQNASCRPHYRHVALRPRPGQMFIPPLVSVPRCDGQTDTSVFCGPTPTGTRIREVPVSVVKMGSNGLYDSPQPDRCTVVEVEEHVSCRLMCIEQRTDCNAKQNYNESSCKCVCKDRDTLKPKCSDLHEWNNKECQCICRQKNTDCTTGFIWDQERCTCLKARE